SVACGAAGVVLICQPRLAEGNFAALVAVSVSLFTALAMIGLHRVRHIDTRAVVVHFSATALFFATAAVCLCPRHHGSHGLEPNQWAYLLGVGLTATVGQICLTKAFTLGDPAKISV